MTDLEAPQAVDGRVKPGHDGAKPLGPEQAKERAGIERRPWLSPMNRRRLDNFRRNRRGAWSLLDLSGPVRRFIVCRVHRQRSAPGRLLQRRDPVPDPLRLSRGQVRRVPGARGFSRPLHRRRDQGAWLDGLAADPLRQLDHHPQPADAAADAPDLDAERRPMPRRAREAESQGRRDRTAPLQQARTALAWLRSGRARHRRPPHLRLSHLDSVRPDARRRLVGDRRLRRRGAGLFRRLARSHDAAGDRDLVVAAASLHPHHPLGDPRAELLRPPDDPAPVLVGEPRSSRAGRVPARAAISNMSTRRARSGSPTPRSSSSTCCRTRWWRR